MSVSLALMLMLTFGVLIVTILSFHNKNNPSLSG